MVNNYDDYWIAGASKDELRQAIDEVYDEMCKYEMFSLAYDRLSYLHNKLVNVWSTNLVVDYQNTNMVCIYRRMMINMGRRDEFDILKICTNNAALLWKESRGIAPDSVASKLDDVMLEWQSELTKTLKIWIDKGLEMTTGELILARANLGAVVESWLKFFYTVHYEDYCNNSITRKDKTGTDIQIEPEEVKFDRLKSFSNGKLWDDHNSDDYKWVESVQQKRNAIHSFKYREIGTAQEFLDDISTLYGFVDNVLSHFPPLEECIESYPE